MSRKKPIRRCKEFQVSEDELKYLIDHVEKSQHRAMLILLSFGMRSGEVAHCRQSWIHVEDKASLEAGANFVEIPKKGELCECPDCLVRRYIEVHQRKDKEYSAEWYREMQRKFYRLKKEKRFKYKTNWSPKSDAGERKIWILNPTHANFVREYFSKNESIGMQRRSVYVAVRNIGHRLLNKTLFPHALRSTAATIMAGKGASSMTLQHQIGWSSIALADIYVKPEEKAALRDLKSVLPSHTHAI